MKKIILFIFLASVVFSAQVPQFTTTNLDGDDIDSAEYIGEQPVILDFWATWCKPCVKNLPKLDKLYQKYKSEGLVVFGVNEDGPRSLSKVEPFVNSLGLTFPVLLDENRDIVRKYNIDSFPTTLLIDKSGEIVYTLKGYRPGDEETLEKEIAKLLNE